MFEVSEPTPHAPAARRRSPETWAAARDAYLGGMSATEVCDRFDLGLSAFRARARDEGWRRVDQDDPAPEPLDDLDEADGTEAGPTELAGMAELAFKRARRAALRGLLREAQGWTRLHRDWRALAAEEASERERQARAAMSPEERAPEIIVRRTFDERLLSLLRAGGPEDDDDADEPGRVGGADEPDDLHDVHDLHRGTAAATAKPPANRRARRQQARLEAWKARQAARSP